MVNRFLKLFTAFFLVILTTLPACKDDDNPADTNNSGCEISAKVDGADFCGMANFVRDGSTAVMTINGINSTTKEAIQFTINNSGVGNFDLGSGIYFGGYTSGSQEVFIAQSGSLVITQLDDKTCKGTFSFIGKSISSGQTKSITNGVFTAKKI